VRTTAPQGIVARSVELEARGRVERSAGPARHLTERLTDGFEQTCLGQRPDERAVDGWKLVDPLRFGQADPLHGLRQHAIEGAQNRTAQARGEPVRHETMVDRLLAAGGDQLEGVRATPGAPSALQTMVDPGNLDRRARGQGGARRVDQATGTPAGQRQALGHGGRTHGGLAADSPLGEVDGDTDAAGERPRLDGAIP
jgi:hypothetical protein